MTDDLNLLLSNGMSLDKVERLMADGIPMSEIATAAQAILDRGETLADTEPDPAVDPTPDPTGKKAKRLSIDIVSTALQELGISLRFNQLLKEAEIKGLPDCYSTENAVNVLPVYLGDNLPINSSGNLPVPGKAAEITVSGGNIEHVYLVTNSEDAYREMSERISVPHVTQLYRDYIDNFVINSRRN